MLKTWHSVLALLNCQIVSGKIESFEEKNNLPTNFQSVSNLKQLLFHIEGEILSMASYSINIT